MPPSFHILHTPAPVAALRAAQDALRAVARRARLRIQAWLRWRRALRTIQALHALDDHMLRDLGIDRSELLSVAFDPADPSRVRARAS